MSSKNLMKNPVAVALAGAVLCIQVSHAADALPDPIRACKLRCA